MPDDKRLNQPTNKESDYQATPPAHDTEQVVNPEALVLDAPLPVSQERAATDQVAQASDPSLPVTQDRGNRDPVTQASDPPLPVTQERVNPDPATQVSALPVSQERAASDPAAQVSDAHVPSIDPASDASLPVSQEQTDPDSVVQEPVAPAPDASVSDVTAPTVDSSEDNQRESPGLSDTSEHSDPEKSTTSSSEATKSSTTSSESRSKLAEPISEQGIGSTEPSSEDSRLLTWTSSHPDSSLSRTNTHESSPSTSDSAVGLGTYQPTQPSYFPSHFDVATSYGYRNVGGYGAGPIRRPDFMSPQSSFESNSDAAPTPPSLSASLAKSPPTGASLTTLTNDTSEAASAQVHSPSVEESVQAVPPPPSSDSRQPPSDRLFLRRHRRENFWIRFFFPRTRRDRCVIRTWKFIVPLFCLIVAFIILFVKFKGDWPTVLEVFMLVLFANSFYWVSWMCCKCATLWAED